MFWGIRTNDEGVWRKDGFYALVQEGKIKLAAPTRAVRYTEDGGSLLLESGTKLKADTVILATGFTSSWSGIFTGDYCYPAAMSLACNPFR